jgi:hypothetical protein
VSTNFIIREKQSAVLDVKPNIITNVRITALPRPMPEGMFDPLPQVWISVDGGEEHLFFTYYPDEISFKPEELKGLTVQQATQLKFQKDSEYLRRK